MPADHAFAYSISQDDVFQGKFVYFGIFAEVQAQQESGREIEGAGAVWPGGLHTAACQVSC